MLPFGDGRGRNQQYINNCLHLHKTGDRKCDRASDLPKEAFLARLTSNSIDLAFTARGDVESARFLAQS